ncbi:hypothetical protein DBR43_11710 [Pedobacter sp. KBW06]|nr:hypothetical protein DBR43_11710 [Pedobacter sp. KBW06]
MLFFGNDMSGLNSGAVYLKKGCYISKSLFLINRGTGEPGRYGFEGTARYLSFLKKKTDSRKSGNRKNRIRADADIWFRCCLERIPSAEFSVAVQILLTLTPVAATGLTSAKKDWIPFLTEHAESTKQPINTNNSSGFKRPAFSLRMGFKILYMSYKHSFF